MDQEQLTFAEAIKRFNAIYKLDSNEMPTLLGSDRIKNFKDILLEEVHEADVLMEKYQAVETGDMSSEQKLALLTEMSDWLGDLVVYCASEARRWGLPLDKILGIIMESNFSKLGADGEPIYDARGKVMKGPDYWKPEPKISAMLQELK